MGSNTSEKSQIDDKILVIQFRIYQTFRQKVILERVGGPQEAHRRPDRGRILGPGAGSGHQSSGRRAGWAQSG